MENTGTESTSASGVDARTSRCTPTSGPSDKPSAGSKTRWRKPRNIREFAAQTNDIATQVLNGEIDMETARLFASLGRVVAQAASLEIARGRFLKSEPDLSLEIKE